VLDGQQRLTSLYCSLYAKDPVSTKNIRGQAIQRYYYLDMKKFLPFLKGEGYGGSGAADGSSRNKRIAITAFSWLTVIVTMFICYAGKWGMYSWRKWFTGRRSYEFL
jgi:hypothetical protein